MEHPVPILQWFRIFGRDFAYWPAAQACFGAEGSGLSKACRLEARSKRQRPNGHSLTFPRDPARPSAVSWFHDVVGGIAQRQQLAPTRWQDRIIEEASPSGNRLQIVRSAIRDQGYAGRSFPRLRPPRFPGRLLRFPEPLTEFVQFP